MTNEFNTNSQILLKLVLIYSVKMLYQWRRTFFRKDSSLSFSFIIRDYLREEKDFLIILYLLHVTIKIEMRLRSFCNFQNHHLMASDTATNMRHQSILMDKIRIFYFRQQCI